MCGVLDAEAMMTGHPVLGYRPGWLHRFCTPTRWRIRWRWHASWQLRGGLVFTVELVGIGMGPGDPDLLTIAAVRNGRGARL